MNELQASLLEAINTLSKGNDNKNVQTVTIEGTIISVDNLEQGVYTADYLGNAIQVFSTGAIYSIGQHVYIIVPNGDYTKNKIILGPTSGAGVEIETDFNDNESKYIEVTKNLFNFSDMSICSYSNDIRSQMLFNDSYYNTFIKTVEKYKKFKFSCDIKTSLPDEQQKRFGEYSISITFKTNMGYIKAKIDTSTILGNPYSLTDWSHQYIIFNIPDNVELDINYTPDISASAGSDFIKKDNQSDDIFFKNISFIAIEEMPVIQGYHLDLIPSNGVLFYLNGVSQTILEPDLKLDGISIADLNKKAQCYWFIQDNSVRDSRDEGYFARAGARWFCLNNKVDGLYVSDPDLSLTVNSSEVFSSSTYKCIIIYNNNAYSQEITLSQLEPRLNFEITSDEESYIADVGQVTLTATAQYSISSNETLSFHWARYDKFGNYIDNINNSQKVTSVLSESITFDTQRIDEKNLFVCTLKSSRYGVIATATKEIITSYPKGIRLALYNTDVVFKYDANGISLFHPSYGGGYANSYAEIKPVQFKLFKENGEEFSILEYKECIIKWYIPENSMFNIDDKFFDETEGYYIIQNRDLNYAIRDFYSASRNQNTITLVVGFEEGVYRQEFDITFLKDGDNGTNGTEYVGIIKPGLNIDRAIVRGHLSEGQQPYILDKLGQKIYSSIPFTVNLYQQGKLIEDGAYSIKWSILDKDSLFIIDEMTGVLTLPPEVLDLNPIAANIVKAEIKINMTTIYAFYMIETVLYDIPNVVDTEFLEGGPYEILFEADGSRAQLKSSDSFVMRKNNSNYGKDLTWNVGNTELFELVETEDKKLYKRDLKILTSLGDNYYTWIEVNGEANNSDYWHYYRPILLRRNTYGMSELNAWDGTRLYLDEEGNYIYSAQVGAGVKNTDNTFSGVIMGVKNNSQKGLFGYDHGVQSFLIDSADGSVVLGKDNEAQIRMETGEDAILRSGNYSEESKTGLEINLTKPYIKYGSGKFEVDEGGNVRAIDGYFEGDIKANSLELAESITFSQDKVNGLKEDLTELTNTDNKTMEELQKTIEDLQETYEVALDAQIKGNLLVEGLGFQKTEITGNYIITPLIKGGYLDILSNDNNRVIIDPNNLGGTGYIFRVDSKNKTAIGFDINGNALFEGAIVGGSTLDIGGSFHVEANGSLNINDRFKVDADGNVTLPPGTKISWSDVTGTEGIATKDDIPEALDDEYITKISQNAITTEFLNAKNITAGSVAAENITGTTITGKVLSGSEITGGTIQIGNNFSVDEDGYVTASGGIFNGTVTMGSNSKIGGFTVTDTDIYKGTLGSSGSVYVSTGKSANVNIGGSGTGATTWAFTAGANYGVTTSGSMYASSGKIGGWSIGTSTLTGGNLILNSNGSLSGGSTHEWSIAPDGTATFNKGIFKGDITGSSIDLKNSSNANLFKIDPDAGSVGKIYIGPFTVDNNSMFNGTWGGSGGNPPNVFICSGSNGSYSIGGSSQQSGWVFGSGKAFGVHKDGAVYANDIHVNGGSIGQWSVESFDSMSGCLVGGGDSVGYKMVFFPKGKTFSGTGNILFFIVIYDINNKPIYGFGNTGVVSIP